MDESWVVAIRDQCQAAGVPFFFKQWGGVRKSKAGRLLSGQLYSDFPKLTDYPVLDSPIRKRAIAEIEQHGPAAAIYEKPS